ncbi:Leucine-rich repeat protein [Handroanthus impetiginosus]|uniref:Leucine-rich repeat protein n=1 Tax=Handroanthus impetiginosus TaxID=429701 RepID=A0A2G9G8N5_9LAMI|nr:Leucine-rich repeat protein [Handroanthus impetiginosus]
MELAIRYFGKNTTFGCIERERKALLKLKESFIDPFNRLSSWNTKDCCTWQGVVCHKIIAHVIKLDLRNVDPFVELEYANQLSSKLLDSFLLELKHLSYLDLSLNNFQLIPIPPFLGSMNELKYLNLSAANFSGVVPNYLGNLSSLHVFDIGARIGDLTIDNLMWLSNLSSLEHLHVSSINLSRSKDLFQILNMLPSIVVLDLSASGLDNTHLPHACVNSSLLPNIQNLELQGNSFVGEFPCFLQNMTSLRVLDLSYNMYSFSSPRPLRLRNLVGLNLELGEFTQLNYLHLSFNSFSGPISTSLGKLSTLRGLYLSHNQLSGESPISLGQLSDIEEIDLGFNSLNITLSEAHFARLAKLNFLRLAANTLVNFSMRFGWVPPFQLKELSLGSCKIGGQFSQWIHTQKTLEWLDMLNCSISGAIPKWLHYINLTNLDLFNNHIEGPIPDSLCEMKANLLKLELLILSSSRLSGFIPSSIGGAYSLGWLHLNNNNLIGKLLPALKNCTNLIILDTGDNKLTGKLPEWIGKYLLDLSVLILRNNEFHGSIPSAFCQPSKLQVMDLSNNNLTGGVPPCFGNFRGMVKGLVPERWASDEKLHQVMKGEELEYTANSRFLVNLDLSNNFLDGEIPLEITNLFALMGLNLSHNDSGGTIPRKIGKLKSLESLDLSSNNLFGTIPHSLLDLNFIDHLNLSHNNLFRKIPTGNQLQTLDDPSIYAGNPGLCGAPLLKKCRDDDESESSNVENQEHL